MIATSRLFVRHLGPSDYLNFAALESDPEVKKFSGGPRALPEEGYTRLVSDDSMHVSPSAHLKMVVSSADAVSGRPTTA